MTTSVKLWVASIYYGEESFDDYIDGIGYVIGVYSSMERAKAALSEELDVDLKWCRDYPEDKHGECDERLNGTLRWRGCVVDFLTVDRFELDANTVTDMIASLPIPS